MVKFTSVELRKTSSRKGSCRQIWVSGKDGAWEFQQGKGYVFAVSGVLVKSGVAYGGQAVQLWGRPVGSKHAFAALSSAVSGTDGSVAFTVTPARSMRYFLYFPGTSEAPAAKSTTRTIAVS